MKQRLASLVSGSGTTMQAIIKACKSGEVQMDIACVIASSSTAGGIEKAKRLGIPGRDIIIINPEDFRRENKRVDQDAFGFAILQELRKRGVSVVTQNGWMPLTPINVIDQFSDAIFNQHPGPVPEFGGEGMYGRRVHAARLLFVRETKRDYWTQAIVQRVHQDFDQGEVVKSEQVDIFPDDTVDDLAQRVLSIEHQAQIELLRDVVNGNVKEVTGKEKLVHPGEEKILYQAKRAAELLYPHG